LTQLSSKENEVGLLHLRARWYDAYLNRFVSPDTIVPNPANPQSLNRYAYAYNNPVKYRDPSGHIVETLWDVANIAIGVGSLSYNLYEGNYVDAAIDAGGLVVDVAATAVPFVPGGAGAAIKAVRLANKVDNVVDAVNAVDNTVDTVNAVDNTLDAAKYTDEVVGSADEVTTGTKFWNRTTDFQGHKVYQRNDLIDSNLVDAQGRTNLERMQKGLAPLGPDGKSINLHHMTQMDDGAIAEVTQTFHYGNYGTIHINPNTIPSGIDRKAFEAWKKDYWKNRALDFIE
jgi:RHS repeat-associated protein